MLILGKALGGGYTPISAVAGDDDVLGLLQPGEHGSTFGGNPLSCALSRTALQILEDEDLVKRSKLLGKRFRSALRSGLNPQIVKEVRGRGLLNAIELQPSAGSGRYFSESLQARGILAKETHQTTVRFAPPLVIEEKDLDWATQVLLDLFSKSQSQWSLSA